MTTKLQEIINYKKEEFSYRKEHTDESELNLSIDKQEKPRGFIKKLNNLKKLNLLNCFGFAAISYFEQKKRGPKGPFKYQILNN